MFKKLKRDFGKYTGYTLASASAKLKSEVANSYLNWIWWVLDPLCFMLIYTFIFGYVFEAREPYFPVFIFIGLSMWDFFNKTVTLSVRAVKVDKPVISKVYLPKYFLCLTKIWINGFKMLISFGLLIVMMVIYQVPVTWNVVFLIPILLTLALFTFGIGCFVMHFGVYVEDLSNVIAIGLRFMFYLTGVFYNLEKKVPVVGELMNKVNPMAFLISSMRDSLLYSQTPNLPLLGIWFLISLVLALLGILLVYKGENSYLKAI